MDKDSTLSAAVQYRARARDGHRPIRRQEMTRPTERALLTSDLPMFRRIINDRPAILAPLADTTDLNRQSYLMVLADLFWQLWCHVIGAHHLLEQGLEASLLVVERAIFEAAVGIGYLVKHPNREFESLVFLAYSYLREQDEFSHQPDLVSDRARVLARMPSTAVAEARRRKDTYPRSWSGKTIKDMAQDGGVQGYDTLYRILCGTAHASLVGRHVKVIDTQDGKRTIETGIDLTSHNAEAHANFCRRMLHTSFRILLRELDAQPFSLPTWDPNQWDLPGHLAGER